MKTDDKLDRIPLRQPANQSDNLKDAIRLVVTLTDQAKEAAQKSIDIFRKTKVFSSRRAGHY